jgi:hypothetical protein
MKLNHLNWKKHKNWLMVWRRDEKDGITWDELQAVKNKAFGKEITAIEIYPAESELVNIKNMRHLWVVPGLELPNLKTMLAERENEKAKGKN